MDLFRNPHIRLVTSNTLLLNEKTDTLLVKELAVAKG